MTIKADSRTFFAFDLDDTLYYEIDYLTSAFRFISTSVDPYDRDKLFYIMLEIYKSGDNTFEYLIQKYPLKNLSLEKLLILYRNHQPDINPRKGVLEMLCKLRNKGAGTGVITNGRSITQRNKIRALGIEQYIEEVIISEEFGREKPDPVIYEYLMNKNPGYQFYMFGDNPKIDFISARKFSWNCIGVRGERNINRKETTDLGKIFLPDQYIDEFSEIEII